MPKYVQPFPLHQSCNTGSRHSLLQFGILVANPSQKSGSFLGHAPPAAVGQFSNLANICKCWIFLVVITSYIILHAAVIPFANVCSFCFTTKRSLLQRFYVINDGRGKDLRMIPRMHIHLLHSLALLPSKVLIRPNHNSFWVKFFVI